MEARLQSVNNLLLLSTLVDRETVQQYRDTVNGNNNEHLPSASSPHMP